MISVERFSTVASPLRRYAVERGTVRSNLPRGPSKETRQWPSEPPSAPPTTYLLRGEATVENLSTEIISLLAPRLPPNVDAVGVYIYEGHGKGSHIISRIKGLP